MIELTNPPVLLPTRVASSPLNSRDIFRFLELPTELRTLIYELLIPPEHYVELRIVKFDEFRP